MTAQQTSNLSARPAQMLQTDTAVQKFEAQQRANAHLWRVAARLLRARPLTSLLLTLMFALPLTVSTLVWAELQRDDDFGVNAQTTFTATGKSVVVAMANANGVCLQADEWAVWCTDSDLQKESARAGKGRRPTPLQSALPPGIHALTFGVADPLATVGKLTGPVTLISGNLTDSRFKGMVDPQRSVPTASSVFVSATFAHSFGVAVGDRMMMGDHTYRIERVVKGPASPAVLVGTSHPLAVPVNEAVIFDRTLTDAERAALNREGWAERWRDNFADPDEVAVTQKGAFLFAFLLNLIARMFAGAAAESLKREQGPLISTLSDLGATPAMLRRLTRNQLALTGTTGILVGVLLTLGWLKARTAYFNATSLTAAANTQVPWNCLVPSALLTAVIVLWLANTRGFSTPWFRTPWLRRPRRAITTVGLLGKRVVATSASQRRWLYAGLLSVALLTALVGIRGVGYFPANDPRSNLTAHGLVAPGVITVDLGCPNGPGAPDSSGSGAEGAPLCFAQPDLSLLPDTSLAAEAVWGVNHKFATARVVYDFCITKVRLDSNDCPRLYEGDADLISILIGRPAPESATRTLARGGVVVFNPDLIRGGLISLTPSDHTYQIPATAISGASRTIAVAGPRVFQRMGLNHQFSRAFAVIGVDAADTPQHITELGARLGRNYSVSSMSTINGRPRMAPAWGMTGILLVATSAAAGLNLATARAAFLSLVALGARRRDLALLVIRAVYLPLAVVVPIGTLIGAIQPVQQWVALQGRTQLLLDPWWLPFTVLGTPIVATLLALGFASWRPALKRRHTRNLRPS